MKNRILAVLSVMGIFIIYEMVRKIWVGVARERLPEASDITKWLFGLICGIILTVLILTIFRGLKFWKENCLKELDKQNKEDGY